MQWFPVCVCCLLLLAGRSEGGALMFRTLDALTRGVHYLQEHVADINLDAVFTARQIQELMQTLLTFHEDEFRTVRHWLEVLRDKARRIADQGSLQVQENDPQYSAVVGFVMEESVKSVWYPSRPTDEQFVENRVLCSSPEYYFNETASDQCLNELAKKDVDGEHCSVSSSCKKFNSVRYQRDYSLTHQLLFWMVMEMRQCVDKVPEELQQRFCANVLRDAEYIASADFPNSHRDLFMEQIGLCGMWGFNSFSKPDWLEMILEWQQPSGCYTRVPPFGRYYCTDNLHPDPPGRVKRAERVLSDQCLAHKTSVAMLALVANLRFQAEMAYKEMDKSENLLNKLLS